MGRRFPRAVLLVLAATCALVGAGVAAPAADARVCAQPVGPPVTKAEYESRLIAALEPVKQVSALAKRITRTSSRRSDARVFEQIRRLYRSACLPAGRISPPLEIADIHRQIVVALGNLSFDAREARIALIRNQRSRYGRALGGFRHYGRVLKRLGQQLTALGF